MCDLDRFSKIQSQLWIYLTGKARYKIVFLKGRNTWVANPILQGKDYTHLTHMLQDIL